MIYDEETGPAARAPVVVDPLDPTRRKRVAGGHAGRGPAACRVMRGGPRRSTSRRRSTRRARARRDAARPAAPRHQALRQPAPVPGRPRRSSCTSSRRAWSWRREGLVRRAEPAPRLPRPQRDDAGRPARARRDAAVPARASSATPRACTGSASARAPPSRRRARGGARSSGAEPAEIVFTASGSESDNMALRGRRRRGRRRRGAALVVQRDRAPRGPQHARRPCARRAGRSRSSRVGEDGVVDLDDLAREARRRRPRSSR